MVKEIKFTQKNFIREFTDNLANMEVMNRKELRKMFRHTLNAFGIPDTRLEIIITPLTLEAQDESGMVYSITLYRDYKSSQFIFVEDRGKEAAVLFFQCCNNVGLFNHCVYGKFARTSEFEKWEEMGIMWYHIHFLAPVLGKFDPHRLDKIDLTQEQEIMFDEWLTDRRRDPLELSDEKLKEYRDRLKKIFGLQDNDFE